MGKRRIVFVLLLTSILFITKNAIGMKAMGDPEKIFFTSSEMCGECHAEIYKNWKRSLHALSLEDPIFDVVYMQALKISNGRAKELCFRCHAPLAWINKDFSLTQEISREGISCDFCHSIVSFDPNDPVYPYKIKPGKVKRGPFKGALSPAHKTEYSELHTKSEICAGCHELRGKNNTPIISTYTEWRNGPYSREGKECQTCHMPYVEGNIVKPELKRVKRRINLHNIQGGHSISQLSKAARVEILKINRKKDRILIEVGIRNVGSGHMIPTGIPSRKLVLRVSLKNKKGAEIYREEMEFKKVMADEEGRILKTDAEILLKSARIYSDNRIPPKGIKKVRFVFPVRDKIFDRIEAKLFYKYKPLVIIPQEMSVEMAKDIKLLKR